MLQRRLQLLALACVAIVTLGVVVSADAGQRKRMRQIVAASCACQTGQAKAGQTKNGAKATVDVICPMYMWADHGSYCSYYAIPCVDGVQQDPVNYDGDCGIASTSPCDNCIPRFRKDEVPIPGKKDVVADKYKVGCDKCPMDKFCPIGFAASSIVKIRVPAVGGGKKDAWVRFSNSFVEHKKIVKFTPEDGPEVYVQLFDVTVHTEPANETLAKDIAFLSDKTFYVGHQVDEVTDFEDKKAAEVVKQGTMNTRIYLVTHKGGQHKYTVILNKLRP